GDQGIERSVAEEDAQPLPVSFTTRWDRRQGEHGANQAWALENGGERHSAALAEAAENRIRVFTRDVLDGFEGNVARLEDFARVEGDALRSFLEPVPGPPSLLERDRRRERDHAEGGIELPGERQQVALVGAEAVEQDQGPRAGRRSRHLDAPELHTRSPSSSRNGVAVRSGLLVRHLRHGGDELVRLDRL